MTCHRWNEDWIAAVYGELDQATQRELDSHAGACAECKGRLDALAHSSALLRSAAPEVPATPRVVVLRPRQSWRSAWAFAMGAAAAATVLMGLLFVSPRQTVAPGHVHGDPSSAAADGMREELAALKQRLGALEHGAVVEANEDRSPLSQAELQRELRAFFERQDAQRAADLQYVFEAVSATEQRLDRNAQALTYLALRENPRITEY